MHFIALSTFVRGVEETKGSLSAGGGFKPTIIIYHQLFASSVYRMENIITYLAHLNIIYQRYITRLLVHIYY